METNRMKSKSLFTLAAVVAVTGAGLALCARGQAKKEAAPATRTIVHYGDLKWTPIMKGMDLAVVSGDPSAAGGLYVVRIRCAEGTKIPPHWHPEDENVTVLKGTLLVGMGETFDESKLQTMNVGNFIAVAKEMRHFAVSKVETIVQVHGVGRFKVNWVNRAEVIPPDAKK